MTIEDLKNLISKDTLALFGPFWGAVAVAVSMLFVWARNYWELRELRAKVLTTERSVEVSTDAPPTAKRATRKRSSPQQENGAKKFSVRIAVGSVVLLAVSVASAAYTFPEMLHRLEKANQPVQTLIVYREAPPKTVSSPDTPRKPSIAFTQAPTLSPASKPASQAPADNQVRGKMLSDAFHFHKHYIAKILITDASIADRYPVIYLTAGGDLITPARMAVGQMHTQLNTPWGVCSVFAIHDKLFFFDPNGVIFKGVPGSTDNAVTAGYVTLPFYSDTGDK